jgi:transcriptional regulator of arginine metabolism
MHKHSSAAKTARQNALLEAIRSEEIRTQNDLVAALRRRGLSATQVSVSRDIAELGLGKVRGRYEPPTVTRGHDDPSLPLRAWVRDVAQAGPNLVVIRCEVGTAQRIGLAIDQSGLPGVVGTLAGDDTVFVATASAAANYSLTEHLRGQMRR